MKIFTFWGVRTLYHCVFLYIQLIWIQLIYEDFNRPSAVFSHVHLPKYTKGNVFKFPQKKSDALFKQEIITTVQRYIEEIWWNLLLYTSCGIILICGSQCLWLLTFSLLVGTLFRVFLCLNGFFSFHSRIFTHMETSPLPVKGCKFWRMLGTHGHWQVRVL